MAQDNTPENRRISKSLKNADQFQRSMIEGFRWTTSHSKIVLGVIVLFLLVGGGLALNSYQKTKAENQVQEKYFVIEKQYMEKKAGFEQAEQAKAKKASPPADKNAPVPAAASGDLQKDFGDIPASFENLIKEYPKSRGAQMAALNLSDIYLEYKKPEEALRVLNEVAPHLGRSDMLSALVLSQLGSVYADQNNCKEALTHWEKIVNTKGLGFAHDEAKIRMGLCYETMNDLGKAEALYTEVSKKDDANGDFGASKDAEKYLRLLKMKKNMTGSGS